MLKFDKETFLIIGAMILIIVIILFFVFQNHFRNNSGYEQSNTQSTTVIGSSIAESTEAESSETAPETTLAAASSSDPKYEGLFKLKGIKSLKRVAQLTGKESINKTDKYKVDGTDLGFMVEHKEKLYMVFGDTFGPRKVTQQGGGGDNWRSNVIAVSEDSDPSDGITFDGMITDISGKAKELIKSNKNESEITVIPTSGFSIGEKLYLTFMSIKKWGARGVWEANYGGLAVSDEKLEYWEKLDNIRWEKETNFTQACAVLKDGEVYFWSTPAGRFGGVKLMKVPVGGVEDMKQYVYYAGEKAEGPVWSPDMEKAVEIVPAPVGELSVIWNEELGRWLMAYIKENGIGQIEIREGLNPWGPWGEPHILASGVQYPILYGSYMHPKFIEDNGRTIYFAMSQWIPYNVFWMRAELDVDGE